MAAPTGAATEEIGDENESGGEHPGMKKRCQA